MKEQPTDQKLVDSVLAGNKNAFNLLVLRYQNRLAHIVSKYVNSSDVQDIVQEAFIRAYRSLASFRGESAFYTWIYRIAVNTAKNHLIALGRRPPSSDIDAQEAENYQNSIFLKDNNDPESILLSDEVQKVVFKAIDSLPSELKMVITLRELEGLSYEEIANVMNTPVGTVRSRIFRAREAIDTQLNLLQKS